MRQIKAPGQRSVSTTFFRDHTYSARLQGDVLALSIPAQLVVELYRQRIITLDEEQPIEVELDGKYLGKMTITEVGIPQNTEHMAPVIYKLEKR